MARKARARDKSSSPVLEPEEGSRVRLREDRPKPDFEIHVRVLNVVEVGEGGSYALDPRSPSSLLCEKIVLGTATTVLAPLEHPAYCETCRERFPELPKGSRWAVVMFRRGF